MMEITYGRKYWEVKNRNRKDLAGKGPSRERTGLEKTGLEKTWRRKDLGGKNRDGKDQGGKDLERKRPEEEKLLGEIGLEKTCGAKTEGGEVQVARMNGF